MMSVAVQVLGFLLTNCTHGVVRCGPHRFLGFLIYRARAVSKNGKDGFSVRTQNWKLAEIFPDCYEKCIGLKLFTAPLIMHVYLQLSKMLFCCLIQLLRPHTVWCKQLTRTGTNSGFALLLQRALTGQNKLRPAEAVATSRMLFSTGFNYANRSIKTNDSGSWIKERPAVSFHSQKVRYW